MSMEKFSRQRHPDWPKATVRKNGSLCINRRAIEEFGLQEMHFVTLHFDSEKSLLGIKPEPDNTDPSLFKVSREKNRTHVISCVSFLNHYGIPYKEASKTFKPIWDEKTKMLLVKIS